MLRELKSAKKCFTRCFIFLALIGFQPKCFLISLLKASKYD